MSSEIVEPEIERIKLSLAEENLIEQIRNYITKVEMLFQEIDVTIDDIFRHKFESAKTRVIKVYEDLRSVYGFQSTVARYAAKVSVTITNGYYYLSLVDSLMSLTDSLHKLVLDLELTCSAQPRLSETLILYIQNFVKQLREYISYIRSLLLYLIENPTKVPGLATLMEKNFNEILYMIRTIYVNQEGESKGSILGELLTTLIDLLHNFHIIGEKALWLYTTRAS
ncbi:MAG: hypothetical protein QW775_00480 [Ignisphaera sp.]|uniref:DUF47 family protein n=1 Tax=Ignisphaera aggregans TaxID=334771 RepID=A0A7C4NLX1_9CREN